MFDAQSVNHYGYIRAIVVSSIWMVSPSCVTADTRSLHVHSHNLHASQPIIYTTFPYKHTYAITYTTFTHTHTQLYTLLSHTHTHTIIYTTFTHTCNYTHYFHTHLYTLLSHYFHNYYSSGAVWESRWTSWAVRPNEPSGFRGRKDLLNRALALVTTCP